MVQSNTNEDLYSTCPIPDVAGFCKLISACPMRIADCAIDTNQSTILLKQVNSNGESGYPLSVTQQQQIEAGCIQGVITSCGTGSCDNTEIVKVTGYNAESGELTLSRSNPMEHKGTDLEINLGKVTPELINNMLDVLAKLRKAHCAPFPPLALRNVAGIGYASYNPNPNTAPTFVTQEDPNWIAFLELYNLTPTNEDEDSALLNLFDYMAQCSTCNDVETKNLDILKEVISIFCGKTECIKEGLDVLCRATITDSCIKFDETVDSKCGFTKNYLYDTKVVGGINPALIQFFTPASGVTSPLEVSFIGTVSSTTNVHDEKIDYDEKTVTMPCTGKIEIHGDLTTGWSKGASHSYLEIKDSNGVVLETLTTVFSDGRGQERGLGYVDYNHSLDQSSYLLCSNQYDAGSVLTLCWASQFYLEVGQDPETQKAAIYKYGHSVEFVPTCN